MPELEDLVKKTNAEYMEAVDDEQDIMDKHFGRSRLGLTARVLDDEQILPEVCTSGGRYEDTILTQRG